MFEDRAGVDVVLALHLDLTGRSVGRLPAAEGRTFIVEPYDLLASFGYACNGGLTAGAWWQSLKGRRELAWFHRDDPVLFLSMWVRLLMRAVGHAAQGSWAWLGRWTRPRRIGHPGVIASKPRPLRGA